MKGILKRIEGLMVAIAFAEAAEFDTARETMLEMEQPLHVGRKSANLVSTQTRIDRSPRL